ncbi:MAG: N-acetyl-gamma-glutamyl-phosphate reductase [Acidobacteria bacterium]|nr:N-acetyl-gamma-glutamyl-phosphate reductase [Acidobacteriota bacterium]MCW5950599.1 N-acetyl-gamma-glutamyl-phosphate reductase [Pyrinomonadaceae bacterium]
MDTSTTKIKVAIIGGSGYGGSELLRILLFHPGVEIVFVTANEHAGRPVGDVHRNLLELTELCFSSMPTSVSEFDGIDAVFIALPHGHALEIAPRLPSGVKVIDLSGDFRINDVEAFREYYGLVHAGDIQKEFVYGLTETSRPVISNARRIANPGCFATATILALAPLASAGLLSGSRIVVDAKTGSSGSGAKPAANTHHPQRSNSFYAYKPFLHQHVPEIEQHLSSLGGFNGMTFMTHSMPVTRGIFASCYVQLPYEIEIDLPELYRSAYEHSFFVRIVEGSPDINWVKNTNFCDIAVHGRGRDFVVFSAIDNLVKGASGQAVQNLNLMFGLDETTGLRLTGSNP